MFATEAINRLAAWALVTCLVWQSVLLCSAHPGKARDTVSWARCATSEPDVGHVKAMMSFQAEHSARSKAATPLYRVYFPVVFHVFESLEDGISVPDVVIEEQVRHANNAFGSVEPDSNIRFMLRAVRRYADKEMAWSCLDTSNKVACYEKAKAEPDALHIFVCNTVAGSTPVAGVGRLPCELDFDVGGIFDGVMWLNYLAFPTVPGVYEGLPMYEEGDTFLHVGLRLGFRNHY
jgi:hypothetical protein